MDYYFGALGEKPWNPWCEPLLFHSWVRMNRKRQSSSLQVKTFTNASDTRDRRIPSSKEHIQRKINLCQISKGLDQMSLLFKSIACSISTEEETVADKWTARIHDKMNFLLTDIVHECGMRLVYSPNKTKGWSKVGTALTATKLTT